MKALQRILINIIDRFYFPFIRRVLPLQVFRYAAAGGMNMALDIVLYFIVFNFVLHQNDLNLHIVVISPEIAAFLIVFPITFLTGFWLAKNIAFQNSILKTRTQSTRYFMVVLMNILIKYWGIKFFVDVIGIFPSVSNAITTVITVIFSYLMQNYFTFKGHRLDT